MSDSYAVLPVNSAVRTWTISEGHKVPESNGRPISLQELKDIVASLPQVSAVWSPGPQFRDGTLKSIEGWETTVIVGNPGSETEPCEFHLKGGESEFIETIVRAIVALAGPHVIYAHSGGFMQVIN
ncbi:MAG: hypothetical protein Q7T07_09030 [Burkholderiaceae bacterium]|nr:hypothetical protein [Burkholderiaceae bacterium]